MSEEEKLTLDVEVDYGDDDDLERLENALRNVDDAISDTGKGQNTARIDTEADTADANAGLVGIKSNLEALDGSEAEVGVEIEERDFDTVVSEMIEEGAADADTPDVFGNDEFSVDDLTPPSPDDIEDINERMSGVSSVTADGRGPRKKRDVIARLIGDGQEDGVSGFSRSEIDGFLTDTNVNANFDDVFESEDVANEIGLLDAVEADQARRRDISDAERLVAAEGVDIDRVELEEAQGNALSEAVGNTRIGGIDVDGDKNNQGFDTRSPLSKLTDQARELGSEFKNARFTMEQFHAIFASLVPIAVVFIGAMPAAITALAGLAGAALAATAAVGGIGLLGLGGMALTGSGELDIQPILERMQGIFDTFITAFTPLMNRFQPLVESAFDTLEGLANPLASAMAPLTMFESTFEGLLNSIAGGLPSFTRNVIAFGQAAMPILSDVMAFFANTEFMAFFVDQLGRAAGPLKAMAIGLKELVPFLLNLSQGFLAVVGFLTLFAGTIVGILDVVPFLATAIGVVISTLLVLASFTSLLTVLGFALKSSLVAQAGAFLQAGAAAVASALGISTTTLAVIGLISAITLGVAALGLFAAGFDRLRERIGLATSELQKFNDVANSDPGSVGGQIGSPTGMGRGGGNAYNININASSPEERRRAENSVKYEIRNTEQVNSVFGN